MKKIFITFLTLFTISNCVYAIENNLQVENLNISNIEIKSQLNKIKTKRLIISNALLLNDIQRLKADKIFDNYNEKEALIYLQLKQENAILLNLKSQKANKKEQKAQMKNIKNLKKALKSIQKQNDKEFKEILNHNQKVKFNRLRKEIQISNL